MKQSLEITLDSFMKLLSTLIESGVTFKAAEYKADGKNMVLIEFTGGY